MRPVLLLALLATVACPAPAHYAIVRPGMRCQRAVRLAYFTLVQLGYTVNELTEPVGDTPGYLGGTKTGPDGQAVGGRVRIECRADAAIVQPVEDALIPASYEFSRTFDYSFTTLAQQPEEAEGRTGRGLDVSVRVLPPPEQQLDLDGVAIGEGAILARIVVRNGTDRPVRFDAGDVELIAGDGSPVAPLAGAARAAAFLPGPAADRVRPDLLGKTTVGKHTTVVRFAVFRAGRYREARFSITDVETGEADGFVSPVR
jgi:hypothetical protein